MKWRILEIASETWVGLPFCVRQSLHLWWEKGSPAPFILGCRSQAKAASVGHSPRTVLGWSGLLVPMLVATAAQNTQGFQLFSPLRTDHRLPGPMLRYFLKGCKRSPDNSQKAPNFPPIFTMSAMHSIRVCVYFIFQHKIPANCSRTVHPHVLNLHGMMMLKGSLAPTFHVATGSDHLCERLRVCICPHSWENFPSNSPPLQISAKKWAVTAGRQPWPVSCFLSVESYSSL